MTVSIIIPTCNRPEAIEACLSALVPQMAADASMELIICDDSRGSETRDLVVRKFPGAALYSGPQKGPGANRNLGAVRARGEWLIFIDDDCIPRPGYLSGFTDVIRTLPSGANIVLSGLTCPGPEKETSLFREAAYHYGQNALPPACNFAIPREVFLKTGSFDERYRTSFEDIEFFSRFGIMKGVVRFVSDAAVGHPCRQLPSPRSLAQRWEARVISSYDFGAPAWQILLRLPKHVAMVILSRFRGYGWSGENVRAAFSFLGEFLFVLWLLPGWLLKYGTARPSPFWKALWGTNKVPEKYGL